MASALALPAVDQRVPAIVPRFVLVVAGYLALALFSTAEADPVGAAESRYLALLVGVVLAAIAFLAPSGFFELGWTAVLATTAMWAVGYGPHRGALVTVLLTLGLALAALRAGRDGSLITSPGRSAALALGLQALLRGDLLLPPLTDARTLVSLLVLPVASGVAASLLARRFDLRRVGVAAGAVVVLSPGWNVTVTLALVSLAAGSLLAERRLAVPFRAACAAVLAVPPLWDPALGSLFTLGALTFVTGQGRVSWLISTAGITVLVFQPPTRFGTELLEFWAVVFILVPSLVAAPRQGRHLVLRGAFLSLVAAMLGAGPEGLAGGLALAALGIEPKGATAQFQRGWSGLLVLGTAWFAVYPWLRAVPLESLLELFGLASRSSSLAAAVVLVVICGQGLALARRWINPQPFWWIASAAAIAVALAMPVTALVPISFAPVVLSAENPSWSHRFEAREIAGGVLDTHLVHGAALEVGTPVATVRLHDGDQLVGGWEILAGFHTAEWAAARPDVAELAGFRAPEAWLSQIAPGGRFFSQRYRARFHAEQRTAAASVSVRRNPDLPAEVKLTLFRLELRR